MTEVLSQHEIDALLSALNSGELQASDVTEEKEKVKPYDFKGAMRYSRDQWRSIIRIHENFAKLLSSHLSTLLRSLVKVEIDIVEQVNYQEFIALIPPQTILSIFDVRPVEGKIVVEANPPIIYAMVEHLLGGRGDFAYSGNLTEIEMALIQKVFVQVAQTYQEVWSSVEKMQVRWSYIESNPQFLQVAAQNDTVIFVALNVKVGEVTGRWTLCLPHVIVEPLLPKLSTNQLFSTTRRVSEPEQKRLKQNLEPVNVPVIAQLGKATLSVSDLLNLQVGDVVGIETGKIQVKVENVTRFLGNPGQQKGRYAVQIQQVVGQEGDDFQDE